MGFRNASTMFRNEILLFRLSLEFFNYNEFNGVKTGDSFPFDINRPQTAKNEHFTFFSFKARQMISLYNARDWRDKSAWHANTKAVSRINRNLHSRKPSRLLLNDCVANASSEPTQRILIQMFAPKLTGKNWLTAEKRRNFHELTSSLCHPYPLSFSSSFVQNRPLLHTFYGIGSGLFVKRLEKEGCRVEACKA